MIELGTLSDAYRFSRVLSFLGIDASTIKDKIKQFAVKTVSNVQPETINNRIENVQIDENISPEEKQERQAKVDAFKDVFDKMGDSYLETHPDTKEKPYQNFVKAIEEDPEKWGQVLENGNVQTETLINMADSVEKGDSPSVIDVVKLAYGAGSGAMSSLTDKYAVNDGNNPEKTVETNANDKTVESTANDTKSFETNAEAIGATMTAAFAQATDEVKQQMSDYGFTEATPNTEAPSPATKEPTNSVSDDVQQTRSATVDEQLGLVADETDQKETTESLSM